VTNTPVVIDPFLFDRLVADMQREVVAHFAPSTLAAFALTCKANFSSYFDSNLFYAELLIEEIVKANDIGLLRWAVEELGAPLETSNIFALIPLHDRDRSAGLETTKYLISLFLKPLEVKGRATQSRPYWGQGSLSGVQHDALFRLGHYSDSEALITSNLTLAINRKFNPSKILFPYYSGVISQDKMDLIAALEANELLSGPGFQAMYPHLRNASFESDALDVSLHFVDMEIASLQRYPPIFDKVTSFMRFCSFSGCGVRILRYILGKVDEKREYSDAFLALVPAYLEKFGRSGETDCIEMVLSLASVQAMDIEVLKKAVQDCVQASFLSARPQVLACLASVSSISFPLVDEQWLMRAILTQYYWRDLPRGEESRLFDWFAHLAAFIAREKQAGSARYSETELQAFVFDLYRLGSDRILDLLETLGLQLTEANVAVFARDDISYATERQFYANCALVYRVSRLPQYSHLKGIWKQKALELSERKTCQMLSLLLQKGLPNSLEHLLDIFGEQALRKLIVPAVIDSCLQFILSRSYLVQRIHLRRSVDILQTLLWVSRLPFPKAFLAQAKSPQLPPLMRELLRPLHSKV